MNAFAARLLACAREEGFPLAAIVDIAAVVQSGIFGEMLSAYDARIGRGLGAGMGYLARGAEKRRDPRSVFPQAKSMLCVAVPYEALGIGLGVRSGECVESGPWFSRYLDGPDYHGVLKDRVQKVIERAAASGSEPPLQWRICVDSAPVLEKGWAALAGLGWIGKNTLLVTREYGTNVLLAEVLLSCECGNGPVVPEGACGDCRRCVDACPSGALSGAGSLDARKCISYRTLEKSAEAGVDGRECWVAGCDRCQDCCPYNRAAATVTCRGRPHRMSLSWPDAIDMSPEEWSMRTRGSALERLDTVHFVRNVALALINAARGVEQGRRADFCGPLVDLVVRRMEAEADPEARMIWETCLEALKE